VPWEPGWQRHRPVSKWHWPLTQSLQTKAQFSPYVPFRHLVSHLVRDEGRRLQHPWSPGTLLSPRLPTRWEMGLRLVRPIWVLQSPGPNPGHRSLWESVPASELSPTTSTQRDLGARGRGFAGSPWPHGHASGPAHP